MLCLSLYLICNQAVFQFYLLNAPVMRIIRTRRKSQIEGAHMAKTRLNISLDYDLADFIKIYA
ncbi:MAG: hypothetical protein D3910_19475, partial [Candidatus Electrothrix sp. ATG2]|nr:hypothetical protein [Candidatus Electrothrix sp. ATG2]